MRLLSSIPSLLGFVLSSSGLGCSTTDAAPKSEENPIEQDAGTPACEEGAQKCSEDVPETCTGGAWVKAAACATTEICRDGACHAPTQAMLTRYGQIETALTNVGDVVSNPTAFEPAKLLRRAWLDLGKSDEDSNYVSALRAVFNGVPQGHQDLSFKEQRFPYEGYSRYGACLRPFEDHFVVTSVTANPSIDLAPGDEILGIEGHTGEAMFAFARSLPMSSVSRPSAAGARFSAADSVMAGVGKGMVLEVRSAAGTRQVTVGNPSANWVACADPFQRTSPSATTTTYDWKATVRPDGVAVMHLATFYPAFLQSRPLTTDEDFAKAVADAIAALETEWAKIRTAKSIVWDLRGNQGGVTPLGLSVASGFPGAHAGPYTECYHRKMGSKPASFEGPTHHYELSPSDARFAVAPGAKVVVIIDTSNYSAADYFPYFVRNATSVKLVGSTTSGAFGGGRAPFTIPDARYPADWSVDMTGCRAADGTLLEGNGVAPHIEVELSPTDLRNGVDTVLERALLEVK